LERLLIEATLHQLGGNKTRTAETLGISLKTLYNRLNDYSVRDAIDAVYSANERKL
jgi:DNA-binding NtrC family response regulator